MSCFLIYRFPDICMQAGLLGISGLVNDSFILSLTILFYSQVCRHGVLEIGNKTLDIFFVWLMAMTGACMHDKDLDGICALVVHGKLVSPPETLSPVAILDSGRQDRWSFSGKLLVYFRKHCLWFARRLEAMMAGGRSIFILRPTSLSLILVCRFLWWLYLVIVCSIVFLSQVRC